MVENRMYQRKYTTLERFQGLPRDSVDSTLPYGTDCTLYIGLHAGSKPLALDAKVCRTWRGSVGHP